MCTQPSLVTLLSCWDTMDTHLHRFVSQWLKRARDIQDNFTRLVLLPQLPFSHSVLHFPAGARRVKFTSPALVAPRLRWILKYMYLFRIM